MAIEAEHAIQLANALLQAAGMSADQGDAVARRLVDGDLFGHSTHGLALLPLYLERLRSGEIETKRSVQVLTDRGNVFAWDAHRLPGAWVLELAIKQAIQRSREHHVVSASIANSAHVGCLQAYLEAIGEAKLMAIMSVTDPAVSSVAPYGGVEPLLTSNPIAACIPTQGDPILIDQCTSVMSNFAARSWIGKGAKLPGPWLLDASGGISDDPDVLLGDPPGTIQLLGGSEFGYKGFGLSLLVEALALGLSGYGRNVPHARGGQGVFLLIIDPDGFAGKTQFLQQMSEFADRCRDSVPAAPERPVRMPGDRALAHKRERLKNGLHWEEATIIAINHWAHRLGISPFPFC